MKSVLTGAVAALVLGCGAAVAQQQAPAEPPGPPEVKTVDDWQVRCFPVSNANPCDIFQEQVDQRTRQRVLSVSIAFSPSADRHLVQITVPLDIAIQKGLTIQTDSYTSPVLKYRMCTREGCFVQTVADNAMIESLAKSGPDGKINIVTDAGKTFALTFSLKGFSAAHDEMVRLARIKAKPPTGNAAAKP